MNAFLDGIRNFADFSGRTNRKDFWTFVFCDAGITLALALIDGALYSASPGVDFFPALSLVYALALLVPRVSISYRRLNDGGVAQFWMFLTIFWVATVGLNGALAGYLAIKLFNEGGLIHEGSLFQSIPMIFPFFLLLFSNFFWIFLMIPLPIFFCKKSLEVVTPADPQKSPAGKGHGRKPNRIILGAVLVPFVLALMTTSYTMSTTKHTGDSLREIELVEVVKAATDIPTGKPLSRVEITSEMMRAHDDHPVCKEGGPGGHPRCQKPLAPKGALLYGELDSHFGRPIASALEQGEVILESDFQP